MYNGRKRRGKMGRNGHKKLIRGYTKKEKKRKEVGGEGKCGQTIE